MTDAERLTVQSAVKSLNKVIYAAGERAEGWQHQELIKARAELVKCLEGK